MIALRLVRLVEQRSEELASGLIRKLQTSPRTSEMKKVPAEELRSRTHEILQNLSEWLLTKSSSDVESRYVELGARRAAQGVAFSDYAWALVITKEHVWEFLQRQGFLQSPVEIYGQMELMQLLDQFFDHSICFAAEGYERYRQGRAVMQAEPEISTARPS